MDKFDKKLTFSRTELIIRKGYEKKVEWRQKKIQRISRDQYPYKSTPSHYCSASIITLYIGITYFIHFFFQKIQLWHFENSPFTP